MNAVDPLFAQTFAFQASKADRKRLDIIEAGVGQIARHGLTPATFGQIAAAIKTRPSHVSYYYKAREDLLWDVVRYCLASAQAATVRLLSPDASPADGIRAIVRGAFEWGREHPEQARIFLLLHYQAALDPRFAELTEGVRSASQGRIQNLLLKAQPGASAQAAIDLAERIHAFMSGHFLAALTAAKRSDSRRRQKIAEEQSAAWIEEFAAPTSPPRTREPR